MSLKPLFPGTSELDQISLIHDVIGTPPQSLLRRFDELSTHMDVEFDFKRGRGFNLICVAKENQKIVGDLLKRLLTYDPEKRTSAKRALAHDYFSLSVSEKVTLPPLQISKTKRAKAEKASRERKKMRRVLNVKKTYSIGLKNKEKVSFLPRIDGTSLH